MKLSNMKTGMVVITRNHEEFVVLRDLYNGGTIQNLFWNPHDWLPFDRFNDDLTCIPDYDDLFDLYNDLIQFCVDEEKNNEAINAYKGVIEAEKKLVNTTEQHESYLHNLGLNCGSLASLYLSVGQIEDAKKWYFEGIKIFELG